MALLLAIIGLGKEPADLLDEHGDRVVGQLLAKLDDLGDDRRAPTAGVEISGKPGRRDIALPDHLVPAPGMDAALQAGIDIEGANEGAPFHHRDHCWRRVRPEPIVANGTASVRLRDPPSANRRGSEAAQGKSRRSNAASARRRAMARAASPIRSMVSGVGSTTLRSRMVVMIALAIEDPLSVVAAVSIADIKAARRSGAAAVLISR
jgi:hypothetical protein